jgi:preprotein translocase subunit Sec63
MEEKIYEEIVLDNGLKLVVSDLSRKIAADAYVVRMKASILIDVKESIFSPEDKKEFSFENIVKCIGDKVIYEHETERNMIMDHEKDQVFEDLVTVFFNTLVKYLAKPSFPKKIILKEYGNKMK